MNGKTSRIGFAATILMMTISGCTASWDSIPTGRWEGEGRWTGWRKNDHGVVENISGRYPTSVAIAKTSHAGDDLLVIAVVSDHRDDPEFGSSGIRVIMTLAMPVQHADGSVTFDTHADVDICHGSASPEPDPVNIETLLKNKRVPPARLSRIGLRHFLEVRYSSDVKTPDEWEFAETFAFVGGRLIKEGLFDDGSHLRVRWRETLKRCAPSYITRCDPAFRANDDDEFTPSG